MLSPYREVKIFPRLVNIAARLPNKPLTVEEILTARQFYTELTRPFDTSTFVLWEEERFKITSHFPWKDLNPKYLENSPLGQVIALLPSEYGCIQDPEFRIVRASDDPQELYAVYNKRILRKDGYTRQELRSLGAGILERRISSIPDAQMHPIWLGIFQNDKDRLRDYIDWIQTTLAWHNGDAMAIYLKNPQRRSAMTCKICGEGGGFSLEATSGYEEGKIFITED